MPDKLWVTLLTHYLTIYKLKHLTQDSDTYLNLFKIVVKFDFRNLRLGASDMGYSLNQSFLQMRT